MRYGHVEASRGLQACRLTWNTASSRNRFQHRPQQSEAHEAQRFILAHSQRTLKRFSLWQVGQQMTAGSPDKAHCIQYSLLACWIAVFLYLSCYFMSFLSDCFLLWTYTLRLELDKIRNDRVRVSWLQTVFQPGGAIVWSSYVIVAPEHVAGLQHSRHRVIQSRTDVVCFFFKHYFSSMPSKERYMKRGFRGHHT